MSALTSPALVLTAEPCVFLYLATQTYDDLGSAWAINYDHFQLYIVGEIPHYYTLVYTNKHLTTILLLFSLSSRSHSIALDHLHFTL